MATAGLDFSHEEVLRRLECPVCQEYYRKPRMLPCGHTLCSPCLTQMTLRVKMLVSCPECRSDHDLPKSGIEGFPLNIALLRLTEDVNGSDHSSRECAVCGYASGLVTCFHCDSLLCEKCHVQHTPKLHQQIQDLVESFKRDIDNMESVCVSLESEAKDQVKASAHQASSMVDQATKRLMSAIEDKANQLKCQIQSFTETGFEQVEEQHEEAKKILNKSSEFCDNVLSELSTAETNISHESLGIIKALYKEEHSKMSRSKLLIGQHRKENMDLDLGYVDDVIGVLSEDRSPVVCQNSKTNEKEDKQNSNAINILESSFDAAKFCFGSPNPMGVAVHPISKDLYVVDINHHKVQIFNKDGPHKISFGSKGSAEGQFNLPVGIIISRKGNAFISDQNNHRIQIYDGSGSFVKKFGKLGSSPGKFNLPLGMAQDLTDNIHVCDSQNRRVQVFNERGDFKYEYKSWTSVVDEKPFFISITMSGMIAVQLDKWLVVLDRCRQLLNYFPHHLPAIGLCLVDEFRLLMSDRNNDKLKVYNLQGELLRTIRIPGFGDRQATGPTGLAIDGEDIYVSCCRSSMVVKI